MEKQPVGASDDARHATCQRVLVAALVPQVGGAPCLGRFGRRRRVRRRGGISAGRCSRNLVHGQAGVGLQELRCNAGVGIERFWQEPFIGSNLTMGRQSKKSRIYWRERGGTKRAYADLRDYADVGGGREALVAEGDRKST